MLDFWSQISNALKRRLFKLPFKLNESLAILMEMAFSTFMPQQTGV